MTLIELVIVLVIIAILGSIAYPGFRAQAQKGRRADAKTSLMDAAQQLERCFSTYNAYNNVNCGVVTAGGTVNHTSNEGHYQITSTILTANNFALQATPLGVQAQDTRCTGFTLTDTGVETATGADAANCW